MTFFDLITIATLLLVGWYFFNAMRTREMATAIARSYCKRSGIQFLDGTVSLSGVRIVLHGGKFNFRRCYEFHYSAADNTRNIGAIIMIGSEVVSFIIKSDDPTINDSVLEA